MKVYELERSRGQFLMYTYLAITVLIISGLASYFRIKTIKKNERFNSYILLMQEMISNLHKESFRFINKFGDALRIEDDITKVKEIIYKDLKKELNAFSNDVKKKKELESSVNMYNNDIMKHLRNEMSLLKESDYTQLCYHYAGFSPTVIALLMGENSSTIYKRRSRLKEKISKSSAVHKEFFIEKLS